MKLYMDTLDNIKKSVSTTENVVMGYYLNEYKLPLNTAKAKALKINFEISDELIDVTTICELIINSNIAFIYLDFCNLSVEEDSFLYVNTAIKTKCENKIHTFLNIIDANLVKTSTYFTMLDKVAILGNNVDRYQYYLGQFNGGLVRQ